METIENTVIKSYAERCKGMYPGYAPDGYEKLAAEFNRLGSIRDAKHDALRTAIKTHGALTQQAILAQGEYDDAEKAFSELEKAITSGAAFTDQGIEYTHHFATPPEFSVVDYCGRFFVDKNRLGFSAENYNDTEAAQTVAEGETAEVRDLTLAAAEMLMNRGCKALVVACNTATAAAIIDLRAKYTDKIIIGIEPALKVAADHFPGGEVGVMATPVTLREEKFGDLLHRFTDSCTVHKIPAPGLVQLVEAGKGNGAEAEDLLRPLLGPHSGKLDAVVLGCTHYPFAAEAISRLLGQDTALLDGGAGTARETRRRLEAAGLLNDGPGQIVIENSSGCPEITARCLELLEG